MKTYTSLEKLLMNHLKVGDSVNVTATPTDSFHDFCGIIVKINIDDELIAVRDQDDDWFEVTPSQVKLVLVNNP